MAAENTRELDARVAEKVFGYQWWKWTGPGPHDTELAPPGTYYTGGWAACAHADCLDFEAALKNNGVPRYLTDANADYMVLEHVRKHWHATKLADFIEELPEKPHRYEIGLYSRAALAVLGRGALAPAPTAK